ncbi:MAG: hypothetical protein AB2792_10335 [Candidatus Thiodiazotropha sp.]
MATLNAIYPATELLTFRGSSMPSIKAWLTGEDCSLVKSHNAEQRFFKRTPRALPPGRTPRALPPGRTPRALPPGRILKGWGCFRPQRRYHSLM